MATKKERATQIRTATMPGENTAERVGSLMEEFADHQDRVDASLTKLSGDIEGEFDPSIDIDITSYTDGSNFIDRAVYFVSPYYRGRFIPCEAEKTYTFKANANNTSILAYLADTDNITTGATPHFADGWTIVRSVLAGQSVSLKAPIDAKYIWVSSQNGTGRPNDFQSIVREPFTKKGLKDYAMIASVAEQGFPQKDLTVISFVFDDLDINDDDIVNLFNEYGIKCGFAFIASDAKMKENKERYLEYQRQGFSILNHSIDGKIFDETNYPTIESAYAAIMTAKQKLESNGFIVNGFVAPSSVFDSLYIDALRNTHQYAYTTADLSNTRSSNPCNISRESLQTTSLADILGGENIHTSIAFHIAVNRQLTFYGHSADFGTSYDGEVFDLEKIRSVVERCISLRNEGKCIILSPNEMANYFFRGQINTNSNVSANRPRSPQNGMMFFDLTLNKPIWYSGTSWVDANGTNV